MSDPRFDALVAAVREIAGEMEQDETAARGHYARALRGAISYATDAAPDRPTEPREPLEQAAREIVAHLLPYDADAIANGSPEDGTLGHIRLKLERALATIAPVRAVTEREKLQAERDRAGAERSAWVLKLSAENARLRRLVDLWEGKIPPDAFREYDLKGDA